MVSSRVGVPHNLSQPGDESLMSSLWGDVPALKLGSGKNCCCFRCALALFLCPWLVPRPSVFVERPGIFLSL